MVIYKTKITPKELAAIVKLEISSKTFKYVAKKELFKFNLGFLLSFTDKASRHLKIKESKNILEENNSVCSVWIKVEKATGRFLEFEGVSIYYMRFIYESRTTTTNSFKKSAGSQRTATENRQRSANNKSHDYESGRKIESDLGSTRTTGEGLVGVFQTT